MGIRGATENTSILYPQANRIEIADKSSLHTHLKKPVIVTKKMELNSSGCTKDHAYALLGPGACFSKVPIINGPGKLSPFSLKIEVSIVLHVT